MLDLLSMIIPTCTKNSDDQGETCVSQSTQELNESVEKLKRLYFSTSSEIGKASENQMQTAEECYATLREKISQMYSSAKISIDECTFVEIIE